MKYFVISDIHSFYDEMMCALKEHGYNKKNKNHTLIVCGDIFDRGKKPLQVYRFLKSIPKSRRILIRGNHEYLLRDLYMKKFPSEHDYSNGTYDTLAYLSGELSNEEFRIRQVFDRALSDPKIEDFSKLWDNYREEDKKRRDRIFYNNKAEEIINWIFSKDWVDYYEINEYIFVHAFIPVKLNDNMPMYYTCNRKFEYRADWRDASNSDWKIATWGCPWKMYKDGLNQTGKTIICGHWHTSDFWNELDEFDLPRNECPIYKSDKNPGIIGIDGCVALTKNVNVYVIDKK